MSNESLVEIESTIKEKVAELKKANNSKVLVKELNELLDERNNKIKILK